MKRPLAFLGFLACTLAIPAAAQRVPPPPRKEKENKGTLPALVVKAQFVMVVSQREADFNQERDVLDVKAVMDVENAIMKWGRYRIVTRKEDADLIFSVRRIGDAVASTSRTIRRPEIAVDGDHLAVFNAHTGTDGPALWRKSMKDGLASPKMPLLRALQEEIDAAAAKIP